MELAHDEEAGRMPSQKGAGYELDFSKVPFSKYAEWQSGRGSEEGGLRSDNYGFAVSKDLEDYGKRLGKAKK